MTPVLESKIEELEAEIRRHKQDNANMLKKLTESWQDKERLIALLMYSIGYGERWFTMDNLRVPEDKVLKVEKFDDGRKGYHLWVEQN